MPGHAARAAAWHPPHPLPRSRQPRAPPAVRGAARPRAAAATPPRLPRRAVLLLALLHAAPARALCGEPDPYFAHYLDWAEALAQTASGRRVHYRVVGSRRKERRQRKFPVVYLGDAGVALAAGETLELLGDSARRVVRLDMLGVGESDAVRGVVGRAALVETACEDVVAVLADVGVGEGGCVHVVACGFGLEVAEALVREGTGVRVASVAVEGWRPPAGPKGEGVTFAELQGGSVCAVEAAEGGDLEMVRRVYGGREGARMLEAVRKVAGVVPTLALRTFDTEPLETRLREMPRFEEVVFSQAGRVAHLAGAMDTAKALDDFFTRVEGSGKKT